VLLTLSPENTGFMAFQSRIFVLLKGNLLRNAIKSSVKVNDPLEALFEKTGEAFCIKDQVIQWG
jgi:hypothetical protein